MGDTWEIHGRYKGDIWELQGRYMGGIREVYRRYMGEIGEIQGRYMGEIGEGRRKLTSPPASDRSCAEATWHETSRAIACLVRGLELG